MKEKWRPVPGFDGCYEVSNLGGVRSLDRTVIVRGFPRLVKGRRLKPWITSDGYFRHSLSSGGKVRIFPTHRLVAAAFIGERPERMIVLHGDGNPQNNAVTNLRYGTHLENERDKAAHGRLAIGSDVHTSKLTEIQVVEICELLKTHNRTEVAQMYGISRTVICGIASGTGWSHVKVDRSAIPRAWNYPGTRRPLCKRGHDKRGRQSCPVCSNEGAKRRRGTWPPVDGAKKAGRQEPWKELGLSQSTYYRRKKQAAAA